MELTYSSVAQFYSDLKAFLLSSGLTLERTLGTGNDVILGTGSSYFRLRKVSVSPSVVAIGWKFGADVDLLAEAEFDCERFLPFQIQPEAEFAPTFLWEPSSRRVCLCVLPQMVLGMLYRVEIDIDSQMSMVRHENQFSPQFVPNFKDKGGPYVPAGA